MNADGRLSLAWPLLFIAAAVVAATGWSMPANHALYMWLTPLGRHLPEANFIWIIGGPPLTGLVVLLTAIRRRQFAWLWVFLGGVCLEVLTKHWIHASLPRATPEPVWLARIESWASPSAHRALAVLGRVLHLRRTSTATGGFFHSSFFSGHVFRLTFTVSMLVPGRRWVPWIVALAAGILVVATGGHWAWDVVGGFLAARSGLALVHRTRVHR